MKIVPPSIQETAFNCPYCGAYTSQSWAGVVRDPIKTPYLPALEDVEQFAVDHNLSKEKTEEFREYVDSMGRGDPFLDLKETSHYSRRIENMWVSQCFNCDGIAVLGS
jgi:hypothetical protein